MNLYSFSITPLQYPLYWKFITKLTLKHHKLCSVFFFFLNLENRLQERCSIKIKLKDSFLVKFQAIIRISCLFVLCVFQFLEKLLIFVLTIFSRYMKYITLYFLHHNLEIILLFYFSFLFPLKHIFIFFSTNLFFLK